MSEHTSGKLELEEVANDSGHIKHLCPVDSEGMSILTVVEHEGVKFAATYHDADARRLVACWNACEGIPTDDLEACPDGGLFHLADHANQLAIKRDRLSAINAELLDELATLRKERTAWRVTAEKELSSLKASLGEPVAWQKRRLLRNDDNWTKVAVENLQPYRDSPDFAVRPLYAMKETP